MYWFGFALGWCISFVTPVNATGLVGVAVAMVFSLCLSGLNPTLPDVSKDLPSFTWVWDCSLPRWAVEVFARNQVDYYKVLPASVPDAGLPYMYTETTYMFTGYNPSASLSSLIGIMAAINICWTVIAYLIMISSNRSKKA
eukprot:UC1_evm1s2111